MTTLGRVLVGLGLVSTSVMGYQVIGLAKAREGGSVRRTRWRACARGL